MSKPVLTSLETDESSLQGIHLVKDLKHRQRQPLATIRPKRQQVTTSYSVAPSRKPVRRVVTGTTNPPLFGGFSNSNTIISNSNTIADPKAIFKPVFSNDKKPQTAKRQITPAPALPKPVFEKPMRPERPEKTPPQPPIFHVQHEHQPVQPVAAAVNPTYKPAPVVVTSSPSYDPFAFGQTPKPQERRDFKDEIEGLKDSITEFGQYSLSSINPVTPNSLGYGDDSSTVVPVYLTSDLPDLARPKKDTVTSGGPSPDSINEIQDRLDSHPDLFRKTKIHFFLLQGGQC